MVKNIKTAFSFCARNPRQILANWRLNYFI